MIKRDNLYGRRKGRGLRPKKLAQLERLLPELSLSTSSPAPKRLESLFDAPVHSVAMEIGFGAGEHLVTLAKRDPTRGWIGVEPFLNGLAKVVSAIESEKLNNIRLYGEDAGPLLDWCPPESLTDIFLLYPDPWPKTRHHKRRFVSQETLRSIQRVLRSGGRFWVATDIDDYADWTLRHVYEHGGLSWCAERSQDWRRPWADWHRTRFEARALAQGRVPTYLVFQKPKGG